MSGSRIGSLARLRGAGLIAFVVAVLAAAWAAPAASADDSILSTGPLEEIFVNDQLGCQLFHDGSNQFDTGTSEDDEDYCGTFIALADTIYGDRNADELADFNYDEIGQSDVTGSGTSADPFKLTTVVEVPAIILTSASGPAAAQPAAEGDGLLTITETESYVEGDDFYRTDVTVRNNTDGPLEPALYHAGDCRINSNDFGFAVDDAQTGSLFCVPVQQNELTGTASTVPQPGNSNGILGFVPIGGGSNKLEKSAGEGNGPLFEAIDGTQFDNTCAHCVDPETNDPGDNGVGLSWPLSIPGGQQVSRCFLTVNSYSNTVPDIPSGCSPAQSIPATVAQQPPSSCALRISRARVFLFTRHPRLRLVARYRTDHAADVNIDFTAVKNGNKDPLGTVTRHFKKHGLFRLRKQLTEDEAQKLRNTDKFVVNFEIPGEPGFCARQYRKKLTVPRIIDGQRVVFQSDSKFGPGSPGHPED